jgi:hypothetical protein
MVRAASTPCSINICRIALEAQRNARTWRYFQRENALLRRWKSTRREATRTGWGSNV